MNQQPKKNLSLYACAIMLGVWALNAFQVYQTISLTDIRPQYKEQELYTGKNNSLQERLNPQNYKTEIDSNNATYTDINEWHIQNRDRLSAPNHSLRKVMVGIDRAFYRTGSSRSFSWVLFIVLPTILCMACFASTLPMLQKAQLRGEVLWARALFDPNNHSGLYISELLRVSACIIQQANQRGGNFRTLKPIAEATFGKTYLRDDGFFALPFTITGLPFDVPIEVTCDISTDFPCDKELGEKVVSKSRWEDIRLSKANPEATGIELQLSLFTPK